MAVQLKIENFGLANIKERGELLADSLAAQATLSVRTIQGFAVNDFVLIGRPGAEPTELKKILTVTSPSAIVLTANLDYAHSKFDQFISIFGDKIKLYRAPNVNGTQPADGTYSLLSTNDIDPDQPTTTISDNAGSDAYWYKFTYFNSVTSSETNLADSRSVRGGSTNVYCSILAIRKDAGLEANIYISDSDIDQKRRAAQSEIDSALQGIYTVPFVAPINPLIEDICMRIAAGLLLTQNAGSFGGVSVSEGEKKLKSARETLMQIKDRILTITDQTGTSTVIGSAIAVRGYPDDTTSGTQADRSFAMEQRF